jgi:uncharacterized protein (TIRG00374 family)
MDNTDQPTTQSATNRAELEEVRSARKPLLLLVKVVGSGVLLFLLLSRLRLSELVLALREADTLYLGFAVLAGFLFLLVRAYKWFLIVRPYLVAPRFYTVLVSYMFALGISIFTPGRVGEIARIGNIGIREKSGPAALFLFDRFVDVLVVFSMAVFGMYILLPYKVYTLAVSILLCAGVMGLFSMPRIYGKLQGSVVRVPFGTKLDRLFRSVALMERGKIATNILLTISSYAICIFEVYLILRAFCNPKLSMVLAVHPLVMVTNILPVTIGGLGLREGASVVLYGRFGIPEEHAFWAGFLIFVFNTLLHGIVGTVLINVRTGRRAA